MVLKAAPPLPTVPLRHASIDVSQWSFQRVVIVQRQLEPGFSDAHERRAWARLLSAIHAKVHPVFADEYLESLDEEPSPVPLSNPNLSVDLLFRLSRTGQPMIARCPGK